jgi:hypothetical protein
MAFFGTDGDGSAGIVPSTPTGSVTEQATTQDTLYLCGGQVSEAGTPTHVHLYADSYDGSIASDHYVAVYKGGTSSSPVGATLIGKSANITANFGDASQAWESFALSSTAAFSASDYIWVAIIGRGALANFGLRPGVVDGGTATQRGDWTAKGAGSFDYVYNVTSVAGTEPPGTVGSGSWAAQYPLAAYITYTTGGGTARGMPFGNRSTVFNGGRLLTGPIN